MRTKKIDILSYSNYIVLAIILIVFAIGGNNFLTLKSIYATINNGSPLIIITCGVTFALLVGVIDLSVGAIGYAAGVAAGLLMNRLDMPVALAFLCGIALGVFIGWVNSLFIVKFKMNPMLVSLGMMLIIRAIARIFTDDKTVTLGDHVSAMRKARVAALGGMPMLMFGLIAVIIVCTFVLRHTPFGSKLLAVGCDEKVARRIGINTDRIKTAALMTCGGVCGIAGCFWIVTLGSVVTTGLNSYEFLAIAAAVLGGTSLLGGRGSIYPGSVLGALILLFISSGMSNMGVSIYAIPFVRGIIIFIAMYVDSLRTQSMLKTPMSTVQAKSAPAAAKP
ncbi:MAG: ABC transporter permease [Lachnospiraceae bacterium]|jgi:ribose/xylose/arabinose/galactoside ABC-type transport system permease subunit|nr:ABC transporter permease [Lachnospiraceae bacterium]